MFDSRARGLLFFVVLVCVAGLPGCSGGKPAITITLTPAGSAACGTTTTSSCAVTINQGATESITASVANDSTNAGVTWSLGSSVGSLSSSTTTSVVYIAPTAISANTTATVTATSIANTSITATVTITIDAVFEFESNSLPVATQDLPYSATISTIGATGPFTWIILSGSLPPGLTLSNSNTASASITGTPTTVGTSTVTIQATDGAGTPISRTFTITVNPPPALTITTTSLPNGTVGSLYPNSASPNGFTLQAEFGKPPYSWNIIANSAALTAAGLSFSSSGVISGTPNTATSFTFTVQVTDSATPNPASATASLKLTINPSPAFNSELNGNYAFLVSGFDSKGHFAAAGSLVADGNGNVLSGILDTNDLTGPQTNQSFTGTYLIGSDGLGTMLLSIPGVGSRAFALALAPPPSGLATATSGKLIECDGSTCSTSGSGVLLQQDATAFATSAILGNYAFGLLGSDAAGKRYALAGAFHADGAGNFTNGVLDSNDAGTLLPNAPASPTVFTVPAFGPPNATTGRGTLTISTTGHGTANYSFYIVKNTELLAVEIDQVSGLGNPLVSGAMLQADTSFSDSSLNGNSVFETTAEPNLVSQAQVGALAASGSGTLTLSSDLNTGGTAGSGASQCSPTPCTYSVAANGRVTLTNSGFQTADPVLYLVNQNEAFILGTDAAVTFGYMKGQTPPSGGFSAASLSGTYAGGTVAPVLSSIVNQLDIATADGKGNFPSVTTDQTTSVGPVQGKSSTATYSFTSITNGRGTITGTATEIFYMVSPSEYWTLFMGTTPAVEMFQQ